MHEERLLTPLAPCQAGSDSPKLNEDITARGSFSTWNQQDHAKQGRGHDEQGQASEALPGKPEQPSCDARHGKKQIAVDE